MTAACSAVANQNILINTTRSGIAFEVSDNRSDASAINVAVSSSNADVVTDGGLSLQGNSATRQLAVTPVADASGSAVITISATDEAGNQSQVSFDVTVAPDTTAPTIADISDQVIQANSASDAIALSAMDDFAMAGQLVYTFASSNQQLIMESDISLQGDADARAIVITPQVSTVGEATVTVTVEDDASNSAQTTFLVTVEEIQIESSTLLENVTSRGADEEPVSIAEFETQDDDALQALLDSIVDDS